MSNILVGTCGWSYDDWLGPFYPPGTPPSEFLARYAEQFNIVEVDSSFYRIPSVAMVQRWADQTPDGFRFTLKFPQVITHEKKLTDCDDEIEQLNKAIAPLGAKLYGLLLQLGYFNKQAFATPGAFYQRLDEFLGRLPKKWPIAVETRNKNFLRPEFFDVLRGHQTSFAVADQVWMPPIPEMLERFDVLTGPLLYVRLIGDREGIEKITTKWDKVVVDRSEQIAAIVKSLARVMPKTQLAAFINNHYAGYGPAIARAFLDEMSKVMGQGTAKAGKPK